MITPDKDENVMASYMHIDDVLRLRVQYAACHDYVVSTMGKWAPVTCCCCHSSHNIRLQQHMSIASNKKYSSTEI